MVVYVVCYVLLFFFFQAEDGIRDLTVTGVQTCALPICGTGGRFRLSRGSTAGGSRMSGSRACCAGSRRISETGTRKRQRDSCQARTCCGEGAHRTSGKILGDGHGEDVDEQKQRSADGQRRPQ